jgi:nitrogen-specific signal transduction histidine kinase
MEELRLPPTSEERISYRFDIIDDGPGILPETSTKTFFLKFLEPLATLIAAILLELD